MVNLLKDALLAARGHNFQQAQAALARNVDPAHFTVALGHLETLYDVRPGLFRRAPGRKPSRWMDEVHPDHGIVGWLGPCGTRAKRWEWRPANWRHMYVRKTVLISRDWRVKRVVIATFLEIRALCGKIGRIITRTKSIAASLGCTPRTVRNHLETLRAAGYIEFAYELRAGTVEIAVTDMADPAPVRLCTAGKISSPFYQKESKESKETATSGEPKQQDNAADAGPSAGRTSSLTAAQVAQMTDLDVMAAFCLDVRDPDRAIAARREQYWRRRKREKQDGVRQLARETPTRWPGKNPEGVTRKSARQTHTKVRAGKGQAGDEAQDDPPAET